jgi:hypothetical protein
MPVQVPEGLVNTIIHASIPAWLQAGYSTAQMLNMTRSLGYQVRTQTFYNWVREMRPFADFSRAISNLNRAYRIPRWLMNEIELTQPSNYRVFYRYDFLNPYTGEWERDIWASSYTNYIGNQDFLEGMLTERFTERYRERVRMGEVNEPRIENIRVVQVQHYVGRPY